jgi:GlpG protein
MVESRRGSLWYLLFVLASAVVSNVLQYSYEGPELIFFGHHTAGGPYFGGMSGVVCALFGYGWIRPQISLNEPPYFDSRTVFMFMIWNAICLMGFVGSIANIAHGAGLLVGMAVGFIPKILRR